MPDNRHFQGGSGSGPAAGALASAQELEHAGEHALALAAYQELLAGGADGVEVRHGLGCVLHRLGEADAAVRNLRVALEMEEILPSRMGLATIIPGAPSASHADILSARAALSRWLLQDSGAEAEVPFSRDGGRGSKLRVGFLSAFFHRSNYMKPVWGHLNQFSRQEIEIHFFSDAPGSGEWVGYRSRGEDRIHTTLHLDNQALVRLIRRQELDVVVDLNAYSVPGRIPLLLFPLARVTVGWFNAFATYGLPGVNVILGDEEVVTDREEPYYAEEVWRLPQSYLTFSVPYRTPPVSPPPLTEGNPFTFGSLAPQYKMTPPVLDLWARILTEVPGSRLFLANPTLESLHNRAWLLERFVERGVATGRIVFGKPGPHEAFVRQYSSVDVALDTFPYSGGVTTMEALWQGVPVLTMKGDRWAGRTSRTILRSGGLPEWVAEDSEGYFERAVQLAEDPSTPTLLAEMRRTLRDRLSASKACDTEGAARGFLRALRGLVKRQ